MCYEFHSVFVSQVSWRSQLILNTDLSGMYISTKVYVYSDYKKKLTSPIQITFDTCLFIFTLSSII